MNKSMVELFTRRELCHENQGINNTGICKLR